MCKTKNVSYMTLLTIANEDTITIIKLMRPTTPWQGQRISMRRANCYD
jgi:hypothetical protein